MIDESELDFGVVHPDIIKRFDRIEAKVDNLIIKVDNLTASFEQVGTAFSDGINQAVEAIRENGVGGLLKGFMGR